MSGSAELPVAASAGRAHARRGDRGAVRDRPRRTHQPAGARRRGRARPDGEDWESIATYGLDGARTPSKKAAGRSLMKAFGVSAIPEAELARIRVPTALIWGRHDLQARLRVAEAASARYGWPLHAIEDCGVDPNVEQPGAFLDALRAELDGR